ncbi:MAG: BON domain-containing protein [Luteimonas sp.]
MANLTRIPLAIAMSSMLALAVGCSNDRTADDQAAMTPATDPAMQTPPPAATPNTTATGAPRTDAPMDASGTGMDSEQPGSDTWITTKVKSSLLADSDVAGLKIDVETVNGVVTLTGQVEQAAQVTEATRIAREIEGVTDVVTTNLVTTQ